MPKLMALQAMALSIATLLATAAFAQKGDLLISPVYRPADRGEPPNIPPRNPVLPPKEYDRPYNRLGVLIIKRGTAAELREACKGLFSTGAQPLGCTRRAENPHDCVMWIIDDEGLKKYNEDYDIVYRHERGHCLGWRHQ